MSAAASASSLGAEKPFRVQVSAAALGSGIVRPLTYYCVELQRVGRLPAGATQWLEQSQSQRRYDDMATLSRYIQLQHHTLLTVQLPPKSTIASVRTSLVDESELNNQRWSINALVEAVCSEPSLLADPFIQHYLQWPRDDGDIRERKCGVVGFSQARQDVERLIHQREPIVQVNGGAGGGLLRWAASVASSYTSQQPKASVPAAMQPVHAALEHHLKLLDQRHAQLKVVLQHAEGVCKSLCECDVPLSSMASGFSRLAETTAAANFPEFNREVKNNPAMAQVTGAGQPELEVCLGEELSRWKDKLRTEVFWHKGAVDSVRNMMSLIATTSHEKLAALTPQECDHIVGRFMTAHSAALAELFSETSRHLAVAAEAESRKFSGPGTA